MAKKVDSDEQPNSKQWRRFSQLRVNKHTFKRQARKLETATVKHAHRFLVNRWTNIRDVGRLTISWLILVGLLIGLASMQLFWYRDGYTASAPGPGGTYAEGFVGQLQTANPLFATTAPELAASKLLFSGLLTHDKTNTLTPDVADSWSVSEDGKTYDIFLRKDVTWHDGQKLTAEDVVFTVKLMQAEQTKAVQYASWVGVKTEKISDHHIRFVLPSAYAPFAQSLMFGILPKHILKDINPASLRENSFGRNPVGSGPFAFRRLQVIDPNKNRLVLHMEANSSYYRGAPLLNRFQIHTYENSEALSRAFTTSEVAAAAGLNADQLKNIVEKYKSNRVSEALLNDGVFAMMNADSPLLKDAPLRQALVRATNKKAIIEALHNRGVTLNGPLPDSLIPQQAARQEQFNAKEAAGLLDAAGWLKKSNGERAQNGVDLSLNLVAPDEGDYKIVVNELAKQWREQGIKTKVQLVKPKDIATGYLQPRNFDILVYELVIGADPDVYAYWHSTQANPRGLNFANYRSGVSDDILSSARTQLSVALLQAKYRSFTEQWVKDAPAIALYQPKFSYVVDKSVYSIDDSQPVAEAALRYRDVNRWSVQPETVMRTP